MKIYATKKDDLYSKKMELHLNNVSKKVPLNYLVNNFAKYAKRQELTRFLVRHELFKKILNIKGSILECGVFSGNGLMSWSQLSAIYEPVAFFRKIYGFDTFGGFPSVNKKDLEGEQKLDWKKGDVKDESYSDLLNCIKLFDMNRFLPQFPKTSLIKGDFCKTGPIFLKDNPHLIIALLYLDFDLYDPTRKALELFLPRMPKGSILAFDEINNPHWPGETLAFLENLNIRNVRIEKFPYEPNIAYIEL
jgi:hypothetical protein